MDLDIIFTNWTQANQSVSGLSTDFPWPWMNHLPHEWWCNFSSMFLNDSWCVSLIELRGIIYWCFAPLLLLLSLYIAQVLPFIFPLTWFYFYTKYFVLSYPIDVTSTISYIKTIMFYLDCYYNYWASLPWVYQFQSESSKLWNTQTNHSAYDYWLHGQLGL